MIPASNIKFNADRTEAWYVGQFSCILKHDGSPHGPLSCGGAQGRWHPDLHGENVGNLIRPCDTCGGKGEFNSAKHRGHLYYCHDCIDGRHTFEIVVDCTLPMCVNGTPGYWPDGDKCGYCNATGIRTHRVSVVPGMVLEISRYNHDDRFVELVKGNIEHIQDNRDHPDLPAQFGAHNIWIARYRQESATSHVSWMEGPIDLPDDARPGSMWAMKLRVAS